MVDEILCGDSAVVLAGFPDACIDLTVTSPPYDSMRDYNGYRLDFQTVADELLRVTKPGGVVVWVVGDETINGSESITSALQKIYFHKVGFSIHDTMIYAKNGPAHPDQTRYQQVFEYMFVLSKGHPKTINLIADRKNKWAGQKQFGTRTNRSKEGTLDSSTLAGRTIKDVGCRWNIWEINTGFGYSTKDDYAYIHPAIFPEAIAHDHILSWSNPGDLVLDCFAGSGTTLKMAKELGRHWIGIEISQEYCDLCKKRVDAARVPLFT